MSKERNLSFDLLRIVCCFLVIGIHVTPVYDWSSNTDVSQFEKILSLLIQSLVRVGLPVFFIISGMFLLNERLDNITAFYKKRISAILIPFLVFSFIHFLANNLSGNVDNVSYILPQYLKDLTNSIGISVHFWFVYSILGLYLVAPLLSLLISKVDATKALFAIVALIALKAYAVYIKPLIPFIDVPDFPVWVVYFMVGGLLPKLPKFRKQKTLSWLFIGYISTCAFGYIQFNGLMGSDYPIYDAGLNMFIFSVSLCILFKDYLCNVGPKVKRSIIFLSANSYGVYLIHILVLQQLSKYMNMSWSVGHVVVYTISITILVFIVSNGMSFIINKLICDRVLRAIHTR